MPIPCLLLLAIAPLVYAQAPSASADPSLTPQAQATTPLTQLVMPSDPTALLVLARKMNGTDQVGNATWHLKATYKLIDDSGAVKETGTYEEFRVSQKKYKVSYTSPSFTHTDYSTEAGLFRSGAPEWPGSARAMARTSLSPYLPSDKLISDSKVEMIKKPSGTIPLKCVSVDYGYLQGFSLYCFDPSAPILRILAHANGLDQTVYNNIFLSGGAYIARDVQVIRAGKPFAQVHIDMFESPPRVEESIFVAPPEALPIVRRVPFSSEVTAGRLRSGMHLRYPDEARARRIQGMVVLQVVIGRDGKVAEVHPMSGPAELVQASVDAARKAVYDPYLLSGEPVEVETIINVIYRLNR